MTSFLCCDLQKVQYSTKMTVETKARGGERNEINRATDRRKSIDSPFCFIIILIISHWILGQVSSYDGFFFGLLHSYLTFKTSVPSGISAGQKQMTRSRGRVKTDEGRQHPFTYQCRAVEFAMTCLCRNLNEAFAGQDLDDI